MFGLTPCLLLAVIGLIAGAAGGLLGIGGSVVMIPGMVMLLGPEKHHLYQASAMIVNFFVVAPAVMRHQAFQATLRPVTRWMAPSAVAGAILGVFASDLPVFHGRGQGYLQIIFAVFLLYVIVYNSLRLSSGKRLAAMSELDAKGLSKPAISLLVGLPAGLLGGLLGVGGGLVAVPMQQIVLRIPLRNAIANSASTILWSSMVGAVVKNSLLHEHSLRFTDSLLLAVSLAPTALIGSWYASAKVHQWPVRVIRLAFLLLMIYCGGKMFMAGYRQVVLQPID